MTDTAVVMEPVKPVIPRMDVVFPPYVPIPEVDTTPVRYAVYDETGKISANFRMGKVFYDIQDFTGVMHVLGEGDRNTDYVTNPGTDTAAITARPVSTASIDGMQVSAVPVGSLVTIDGTAYTDPVTDGVLELSFAFAGSHTVVLVCWPYLDITFTVVST